MACPHCGEHLLHKQGRALHCCGCGRPRHDLGPAAALSGMRRHGLILLAGLVCLPLTLGLATMEGVRRSSLAQQPSVPLAEP